jgi:hypothetical protein
MGFMAPKMPELPPIETPSREDDEKAIEEAKKKEKERLRKMQGRASTIKTGAKGDLSAAPVARKTLLGE